MTLEFIPFDDSQAERLAAFLAAHDWPFHSGGRPTVASALAWVQEGAFDNDSTRTFWIVDDTVEVGIVRLDDLDDGTPLFDLRLAETARGRGIGTAAVRWLTDYLFAELPAENRIEATTRRDNVAMRVALRRCGYVKESHWRDSWPAADGSVHDGIGYGVLRSDWESGRSTPVDWDDEPV